MRRKTREPQLEKALVGFPEISPQLGDCYSAFASFDKMMTVVEEIERGFLQRIFRCARAIVNRAATHAARALTIGAA